MHDIHNSNDNIECRQMASSDGIVKTETQSGIGVFLLFCADVPFWPGLKQQIC